MKGIGDRPQEDTKKCTMRFATGGKCYARYNGITRGDADTVGGTIEGTVGRYVCWYLLSVAGRSSSWTMLVQTKTNKNCR